MIYSYIHTHASHFSANLPQRLHLVFEQRGDIHRLETLTNWYLGFRVPSSTSRLKG